MRQSSSLLLFCGALAFGEFLASLVPLACDSWPLFLIVALLVGLIGYGLDACGWPVVLAMSLGIVLYFVASEGEVERNREKPWMRDSVTGCRQGRQQGRWAYGVRRDLSRRLSVGLDERDETVALSRAILLGERDDVSPDVRWLFVESGTMHIFAISGLHVMAIADVISSMLAFLLVPRRTRGAVSIPLLWGYVAVIGFPPSAVRAALMATFSLAAPLFWRKPDGLRSWCLAFLVVHIANPLLISDVGNALSFMVMLAIVSAGELGDGLAQWQKTLLETVIAWAIGLPIAAHVFGRVTPGSMLANLVLFGMARLSVTAGTVGLVVGCFSESLAAHLNNLTALGMRTMVFLADVIARIPGSNYETGTWGYLTCVEWYVALALCIFLLLKRQERLISV